MAIPVCCEACLYEFPAKDEHAGKKGKCPSCGEPVQVPNFRGAARRASRTTAKSPASRFRPSAGGSSSQTVLIAGGIGGGLLLIALIGFIAFRMGRAGQPVVDEQAVAQNAQTPQANPAGATPSGAALVPQVASAPTGATLTPAASVPANVPGVDPSAAIPAANGPGLTPTSTAGSSVPAAGDGNSSVGNSDPSATAPPKTFASVADVVAAVEPSVCRITVQLSEGTSTGSGFVIDRDGTVVTNYHVVEDAVGASVVFPDKSQGRVLGVLAVDTKRDLAVLKIDYPSEKLRPVTLATEDPRKGEVVIAIGAPLGLDFSMSEGKVSALRDAASLNQYGGGFEGKWIQTSAPISPGNSGGPLFNMKGEVVAANTLSISGEGAQSLNFATSADNIRDVLSKKTTTVAALSPTSVPKANSSRSGGRPEREVIADETNTEKGRKLLSEIKEVLLFDINISFDSSGRITEYVSNAAERMWKSAGVEVTSRRDAQALMIVVMRFKQAGSSATAKTLEVQTIVLVSDTSSGRPRKVKVWEANDELGSVSEGSLIKGVIPERMRARVLEFFGKIRTAHKQGANAPAGAAKP